MASEPLLLQPAVTPIQYYILEPPEPAVPMLPLPETAPPPIIPLKVADMLRKGCPGLMLAIVEVIVEVRFVIAVCALDPLMEDILLKMVPIMPR